MGMVNGTQWRHARESTVQLFNLLTTYTELEPQVMCNSVDPTKGYECWRKLTQHYDPTCGESELDRINHLLSIPRCKSLSCMITTIESW